MLATTDAEIRLRESERTTVPTLVPDPTGFVNAAMQI
jgi:hypothetical protein